MRCLNSAAEYHKSGQRLGGAVLNHRDYYCVPYRGQRQKVCFDIANFDAVAAELELRIHAPLKKKQAITKSPLVAGPIGTPIAMLKEGGCRELRPLNVAWANIWSRDNNLALLICW